MCSVQNTFGFVDGLATRPKIVDPDTSVMGTTNKKLLLRKTNSILLETTTTTTTMIQIQRDRINRIRDDSPDPVSRRMRNMSHSTRRRRTSHLQLGLGATAHGVGGGLVVFLFLLSQTLVLLQTTTSPSSSMLVSSFSVSPSKSLIVRSCSWWEASTSKGRSVSCNGWVQNSDNGEWEWEEDDPTLLMTTAATATATEQQSTDGTTIDTRATATPQLPSGKLKPKQSLGQNFLKDPNTVAKMIKAFHTDAMKSLGSNSDGEGKGGEEDKSSLKRIIELGPGAGALTDRLVANYGTDVLQCIEVDGRAVEILAEKHPNLVVYHEDVLQVNYRAMAAMVSADDDDDDDSSDSKSLVPLVIIGNLPYYITSQILFALADASHYGAIACATVTMQWEVAQRMVASTSTKDYGILSVVFQTYTSDLHVHFKIPPTVFYPQPKVDSALVGFHFLKPTQLRQRLAGVRPKHFRQVVTTAFRQRRKTVRNSLKKLQLPRPEIKDYSNDDDDDDSDENEGSNKVDEDSAETIVPKEYLMEKLNSPPLPLPQQVLDAQQQGDSFALSQELPLDWASKRPEQLSPAQFVEIARLIFGDTLKENQDDYNESDLGRKVWRKVKHGV